MQVPSSEGSRFVSDLEKAKVVVHGCLRGRRFQIGAEKYTLRELVAKFKRIFSEVHVTSTYRQQALDHLLRLSIAPPPKDADILWILKCRKIQNTYEQILECAKHIPGSTDPKSFQNQAQAAEILRDYLHGMPAVDQRSANALYKITCTDEVLTDKDKADIKKAFNFTDVDRAFSALDNLEKCVEPKRWLKLLEIVASHPNCPPYFKLKKQALQEKEQPLQTVPKDNINFPESPNKDLPVPPRQPSQTVPLASKPSEVVPSQPVTLSNDKQQVFSLANGTALFVHNLGENTLVLKVGEDRYVKFRHFKVRSEPPQTWPDEWIPIGNPPNFYLSKDRFVFELLTHQNKEQYGEYSDIENAVNKFSENASAPVQEVASLQAPLKEAKLAVEMDDKGAFRIVKRQELAIGGMKKVRKETVYEKGQPSQQIARGKIKYKQFSENKEILEALKKEIEITNELEKLGVPNILVMKPGKGQNIKKVRVEMPFVEGGDFYSIVQKGVGKITPETRIERLQYMLQIAKALEVMHKNKRLHNDVKLLNILKGKGGALLADFGSASKVGDSECSSGTFPAPECATNTGDSWFGIATEENERWSYGMALFTMLHGQEEFFGKKWLQQVDEGAIFHKGVASIKATALSISNSLQISEDPADKLIQELLIINPPSKRPTMKDVVERLEKMVG
jgi:serine/threonine protein kinase